DRGLADFRLGARPIQLVQQYVQRVQIRIAKRHRSPLVSIQVQQRGGILIRGLFQIQRFLAGSNHVRYERIQALQLVFGERMPVGDNVVGAARTAVEELD